VESRVADSRGFSAIEMVVTVAGMLTLAAIAVPVMREQLAVFELHGAARQVAADLSKARMRAVAENRRYRIAYSGGQYQLERDVDGTYEAQGAAGVLPTGVSLSIDPDPDVTFRPSGWVDTDAPISITMANGYGGTRAVTVTFGGQVSVADGGE